MSDLPIQIVDENNNPTGNATYIKDDPLVGVPGFEVAGGNLMVADTLGLIDMPGRQTIKLTDKGKHFAKRYPHYASR
jgi:hypothetical protein